MSVEVMDKESSPSPVNHACASCKHQRKRCDANCELAPYFPASKFNEFQNAHKLFGVSNIVKIMSWIEPHQRQAAADSILIEGNAWKGDPVHGCYGVVKDLADQVAFQEKQLSIVKQHLAFHKQQQKIKLEQNQSDHLNDLPDLPDELIGDVKVFERGHNYWSNLVGAADEEKSFDMEYGSPSTGFNGQAGESSAAPKAPEQCLESVKKEEITEDEGAGMEHREKHIKNEF